MTLWPRFPLKHTCTSAPRRSGSLLPNPLAEGSPGSCGAEPACSGAGYSAAVPQDIPEPFGDGRAAVAPSRQADTTSHPELAPHRRHGLHAKKKKQHSSIPGMFPSQLPSRPRSPWEDEGSKRGERDKQFPTESWLKPILQETHGP